MKVGSNWCEWPRGLVPTACRPPLERGWRPGTQSHVPTARRYPQAPDVWGGYEQGVPTACRYPQARDGNMRVRRCSLDSWRMSVPRIEIIRTTYADRHVAGSSPRMRIRRGFHIRPPSGDTEPWQEWQAVALGRVLAVNDTYRGRAVFVGSSALVLHGIPMWVANPDVTLWPYRRRRVYALATVEGTRTVVPQVRVRITTVPPVHAPVVVLGGVQAEAPVDAAVRLAQGSGVIEGAVAVAMVLHRLARFDRFDLSASRGRVEAVRESMLEALEQSGNRRWRNRARRLIASADGGCDSVLEAVVVWIVRTLTDSAVVTQFEVVADGERYFADIALPELRVIIELDGRGKLGDDLASFRLAQRRWMVRQQRIEEAGWRVLRLNWHDLNDFVVLRSRVARFLCAAGGVLMSSYEGLWQVPPFESNGSHRRFYA